MDAPNGHLVDGRKERRFGVSLPAMVTVLGSDEVRVPAVVRNASGRGLAVEMPAPVAPGAALKVEMEDALLLGESIYCRREAGGYIVGLQLDQVLNGLAELSQRLRELADAPAVREA